MSLFQSACHAGHKTETALVFDIFHNFSESEAGNVLLLSLIDLCAAFDNVDHHNILQSFMVVNLCALLWSFLYHGALSREVQWG